MEPITLAMLALGGLALFGGKKKRHRRGADYAVRGPEDRRYWLNEIRNMSNWTTNEFGMMPDLADFLTAIGFLESEFNPAAANPEISDNPMNAARGLFGLRPRTVFKKANGLEHLRNEPNLLLDPRWSFVMAVDHIAGAWRAVVREGSGEPNWLSVRRWWRKPFLVHDFNEDHSESEDVRHRLLVGVDKVNHQYGMNIDPDFIYFPTNAEGYPGIEVMLRSFGLMEAAVA